MGVVVCGEKVELELRVGCKFGFFLLDVVVGTGFVGGKTLILCEVVGFGFCCFYNFLRVMLFFKAVGHCDALRLEIFVFSAIFSEAAELTEGHVEKPFLVVCASVIQEAVCVYFFEKGFCGDVGSVLGNVDVQVFNRFL